MDPIATMICQSARHVKMSRLQCSSVLVGSSWTIIVTLSYDDGSPGSMLGGLAVAKYYLYSIDQLTPVYLTTETRNTNKVRPLCCYTSQQ